MFDPNIQDLHRQWWPDGPSTHIALWDDLYRRPGADYYSKTSVTPGGEAILPSRASRLAPDLERKRITRLVSACT